MILPPTNPLSGYFPAIICTVCDSPIDALVALCVPRDEAMDLVAAAWHANETACIVTNLKGGRPVAVLRQTDGRWAACNAFLGELCITQQEAERKLGKLLKQGRQGCVGHLLRPGAVDVHSEAIHQPLE